MRRADFGTLLGPEVSLRKPPRITVRGHPVQGGSVPLRKAPLRSSVLPWSTKRHCGPLAFRRATEGSRVQRKVRGVKRGQETIWCPVPFCPCRWAPTPPGPPKAAKNPSMGHILAFCIRDAGTGENVNLCLRIEKMCFCIEENYPSDKTKSID